MVTVMSWEQFLVLADIFQTHLRNVHHIEVIILGVPALVLGVLYWGEFKKIRKALEDTTEALRLR